MDVLVEVVHGDVVEHSQEEAEDRRRVAYCWRPKEKNQKLERGEA